MKQLTYALPLLLIFGCSQNKTTYHAFGDPITDENSISIAELASKAAEDETTVKLTAEVAEVCQMKGCWMTLKNENGTPIRVTFKDYGFFMPKDIQGKTVVVEGDLIKKELSDQMARHYAEDAGEAYDSTQSRVEYALVAHGVLLAME